MVIKNNESPAILLIHGLWMTSLIWEHWTEQYSAIGYQVLAPNWPRMDASIEELRSNPKSFAKVGIAEIVDHYERIIRGLDTPPIIMGHSFGGLICQLLLDRGLGAAGVSIAPAPPKGIYLLPFSTLKVSFPALMNPANNHRPIPLTPKQFHYAFTNTLTKEESLYAFDRYAVPGPDHILFQAALANFNPRAATAINFRNDKRAPLLLIAGGKDHVSPPSVVKANYRLYRKSAAVTEYKEFPDRTHYVLGQERWEKVADFALSWALSQVNSIPQSAVTSVSGLGRRNLLHDCGPAARAKFLRQ